MANPSALTERRILYLSRTRDFNPWELVVPGGKVAFYDPMIFAAELTVESDLAGFLHVAEELTERLDLDGWQLLTAAGDVCRQSGQSRELLADPRYRRELEDLLIHGQDWPFGPEYNCEESLNGDFFFRWGQVTLHSRGDELLAASISRSSEQARANLQEQIDDLEDQLSNKRARQGRIPRQRRSGLAERV